jgi:glycosyltransferase involved in cell wall biosynthesis
LSEHFSEWINRLCTPEGTHEGYDVVHFMYKPSNDVIEGLKFPEVVTIHGNGKEGEIFPLNSNFVSQNHAERHGSQTFVYNGLDLKLYQDHSKILNSSNRKNDQKKMSTQKIKGLFFSKTKWSVKNLSFAMGLASRDQRLELSIAGGKGPWFRQMYATLHPRMHWLGEVSDEQKFAMFTSSDLFLFPVRWHEPFGLVVVESMLCGLPVMASPLGSLPELISQKEFGRLLPLNFSDWSQAMTEFINSYRPEDCQQMQESARERFSSAEMAKNYLHLYEKRLNGHKLNLKFPQTQVTSLSKTLGQATMEYLLILLIVLGLGVTVIRKVVQPLLLKYSADVTQRIEKNFFSEKALHNFNPGKL